MIRFDDNLDRILPASGELRELDRGLWVAEAPLRVGGLQLGACMTVVQLRPDALAVISPVALSPELREAFSWV